MHRLCRDDLKRIKDETLKASLLASGGTTARITVHMGTCGISSGADEILAVLKKEATSTGRHDIVITTSGCAGICNREPLVTVEKLGQVPVKYDRMDSHKARRIFHAHVLAGQVVSDWVYARGWEQAEANRAAPVPSSADSAPDILDLPFFKMQQLRVMRNRGLIQAEKIEEYIARDGYVAAAKALHDMAPNQIIQEVKTSGIRGRGGAGFPTGMKWEFTAGSLSDVKYVLCNADEGDPGAFMDRCVLESDPHAVLEGMIIAAKAIGAHQGFVYCRAEYPLAVKMLNLAIGEARDYGLLGRDILGSGFDFDIEVYRGAGAFVCGEETALMTSIEGKRGTPRPRPPFPAVQGLWKKPTVLNNVETLASIPQIIFNGGEWYAQIGTLRSKGTKVFALTGDVHNVGLVEVPMGIALGDIVYDIGGGIPNGNRFKAVQLGGPSGGCIPASHLNTPVDYESIMRMGAIVGSGGMIVMDEHKCMVDVARFFMEFCMEESCGKCTPCRVGTQKMLEVLTRICNGQGRADDIHTLEKWAAVMQHTALCGLGQTAPNPVLSTLRYFREEYEAHIHDRRCPAVVCAGLFKSPCQHACPIGMEIPAYIALTEAGRLEEAYELLLETNPFPAICGRVCDHVCESKCRRSTLDEPVGIKNLKRFITDNAPRPPVTKFRVIHPEKVAVVGAGPSGLTAARDLVFKGYGVTVFEALPAAGGMLRWGIPEYRLPRRILESETKAILDAGVGIRLNTRVGRDISWQAISRQYRAVFLAIGAQKSASLGIPGEDLAGVRGAVEFLRTFNLGQRPTVGRRVAVIGGGNSAIDAARTALRLGAAEVVILYRRLRADMPAQEEEITAAEEEGVKIHYLVSPIRFEGKNGRVGRVVCQKMTLGEFDSDGRRKPAAGGEGAFAQDVDLVLTAAGQALDLDAGFEQTGIQLTPKGWIQIAAGTKSRTTATGFFAGGDAVMGPDTVVGAIFAGHRAAEAIDEMFRSARGEIPRAGGIQKAIRPPAARPDEIREVPRIPLRQADPAERVGGFREVELGFSREEALVESARCLRCDADVE